MYDVIMFDLDGTLTDSGPGIRNSVAHSLGHFDIEAPDPNALNVFIGPPLMDSFKRYYGFDDRQARQAVVYYREYYEAKGIFENSVYDGIEDLLRSLKEAGRTVVMATSKPEAFAVRILGYFGIGHYFDYKAGASMDESRTDKAKVIAYALDKAGVTDPSRVLMVGDREHDVVGARKNGVDCAGVLYGYGSREELEAAGAKYIVETVAGLWPVALNG